MNRAKIQDYIDQREEQRSLIYHIEEKDQTHFTVNGHPYELVKDYRDGFNSEKQVFKLKEFLFDTSGTCSVYIHINAGDSSYTIKANTQLSVPGTKEFLEALKDQPFVKDAWML